MIEALNVSIQAMKYHTLFDITTAQYKDWPYVIAAAAGVVASIIVTLCFYPVPKSWSDLPFFWICLSLAMVRLAGIPYWDYHALLETYRDKKYRVAAGKVENFWHEKRYSRQRKETIEREGFTVRGVKFAYTLKDQSAFANREATRVFFRNGMTLRVSYIPYPQFGSDEPVNQIVKLEEGEEVMTN
jgi:hypothetical protein